MFIKLRNGKLLLLIPCLLLLLPLLPKSPWKEANELAARCKYFQALYPLEAAEKKHGNSLEYRWLQTEVYYELGFYSECVSIMPTKTCNAKSLQLTWKLADALKQGKDWRGLSKVLGLLYGWGEPCFEQYKEVVLLAVVFPSPVPLDEKETRLLNWLHRAANGLRSMADSDFLAVYEDLAPETEYFRIHQDTFGPELREKIREVILDLDATVALTRWQQGQGLPYTSSPELIEAIISRLTGPGYSGQIDLWLRLYRGFPDNPLLASVVAGHLDLADPQEVASILAPYPREDFTRPRWRLEAEKEFNLLFCQVSLSAGGKWLGIRTPDGIILHRLSDGHTREIPGSYASFHWQPQGEGLLLGTEGQEMEVFLLANPLARPRKYAQGPYIDIFWWDSKHAAFKSTEDGKERVKLVNLKGRVVRDAGQWELAVREQPRGFYPPRPDFGPGVSIAGPYGDFWLGQRNINGIRRLIVYHNQYSFGHVEGATASHDREYYLYSEETGKLICWSGFSVKVCRLVPLN